MVHKVIGSNPSRDLSVLGALVQDRDELGQDSP